MDWVIVILLILIVLLFLMALSPLFDIKDNLKHINGNLHTIKHDESIFFELKEIKDEIKFVSTRIEEISNGHGFTNDTLSSIQYTIDNEINNKMSLIMNDINRLIS